jgi:hypothetical protein
LDTIPTVPPTYVRVRLGQKLFPSASVLHEFPSTFHFTDHALWVIWEIQSFDFVVYGGSEGAYLRLVVPTYRPEVRCKWARSLEATGLQCVILFDVPFLIVVLSCTHPGYRAIKYLGLHCTRIHQANSVCKMFLK